MPGSAPVPVEVHLTQGVEHGTPSGSQVEPGVTALLRAARVARVDLGLYLPVSTGGKLTIGLRAPASLTLQLGGDLHVALSSGATIDDVRRAARTTSIPLGLSAAWTVRMGRGGTVGVSPSVTWPSAIRPGPGDPAARGAVVVLVTLSVASPF